ncbi:MAG: glycosyltransferase family 4 protein [Ignavibacteria bacterium]|nr:glycosyltransferase family 4 protein [Ignavibacteria bacterium]
MKIKICHIFDKISGQSDGVFIHLDMLLKYINSNRFEQIVIYQGGEIVEKKLKNLGVKLFKIPTLAKRFSIISIKKIYDILHDERVDIIHAHLIKPYIIAGLMNIFLRKKLIFNYHGLFINSIFHNFFERKILFILHNIICLTKVVDIAITPSKKSKENLISETKLFPQIKNYYNGFEKGNEDLIDIKIVTELKSLKFDSFLISFIGRFEIEKRVDLSLLILKKLIEKEHKVIIAYFGTGKLENEMKILAEELGINHCCKFYGYIPHLSNYLQYFDALLFTSDWEGLPITYWEAMANSVPIVSTDVGGAREILIDNNCGLVYPVDNVDAGVAEIIKLIRNEKLRLKMGFNGVQALQSKYNLEQFKLFFESLYDSLK